MYSQLPKGLLTGLTGVFYFKGKARTLMLHLLALSKLQCIHTTAVQTDD